MDFTDDRKGAGEREAGARIQLLSVSGVEHYGVTDLEWDPSGRYVASSAREIVFVLSHRHFKDVS